MSDPTRMPVDHAEASGSWRTDSPLPEAPEARLTVPLQSLRALSGVRRQARAFLLASLDAGRDRSVVTTVEDVVEQAVLVLDELASNALRHAEPPSSLHIAEEVGRWIIIVTDSAPDRPPTPARDRPAGQGGYGLYVIADLTASHGVHYEPGRKLVWACITKPA